MNRAKLKLRTHHEALEEAKQLEAKARWLNKMGKNPKHVAELKRRAAELRQFHDSQRLLPIEKNCQF